MARKWTANGFAEDEPAKTVDSNGNIIQQSSADVLIQQDRNAQDVPRAQDRTQNLMQRHAQREIEKQQQKVARQQEKLDALENPEFLDRRRVTYSAGQLTTISEEERKQIDICKRTHNAAVAKRQEDAVKRWQEQKKFGDRAAQENLVRLAATMPKELRKAFIDALKGIPDDVA